MRSAIGQTISYNSISGEPGWLLVLRYPPALRNALKQGGEVTRPLGRRASSSTAFPEVILGVWVSASSHIGSTQPHHQTHLCYKCTSWQLCPAPGNLPSMARAGTVRELPCHLFCVHGPLGAWAQGKGLAVCLGAAQGKKHPFPHPAVLLRCMGLLCSSSSSPSALSLCQVDPKLCSQLAISCNTHPPSSG